MNLAIDVAERRAGRGAAQAQVYATPKAVVEKAALASKGR